jgi:hypothetical protein
MFPIDRRTALNGLLAMGATAGVAVPRLPESSVLSWRVVVERDGVHLGIPTDKGQLVISQLHSDAVTVLNLPRADPGLVGWTPAAPPRDPFLTPEFR